MIAVVMKDMKSRSFEEKEKPFRLVKYFTFTSLMIIFIGTIALAKYLEGRGFDE